MGRNSGSCKSKRVPWWFVLLPCSSICSASSSSSKVMDPSTVITSSSEMVKLPISLPFPETSVLHNTDELVSSPIDDDGPSKQQNLCTICLEPLLSNDNNSPASPINGAVFKAQCSHSFHLSCISSNIQHGSLTCPICRDHWTLQPHPSSRLPRRTQGQSIGSTTRAQRRRSSRPRITAQSYHVDSIEHHRQARSVYQPPSLPLSSLVSVGASSPLSQHYNNYHHCYDLCQCSSLDYYSLSSNPSVWATQGWLM